MSDDTPVGRDGTTKVRKESKDVAVPVAHRAGDGAAEKRLVQALLMILDEFPHLVDRLDAAEIALALRLSPREEPVPAKDDPVAARLRFDRLPQHQRQLESGTLPRHPDDVTTVLLV